MTLNMEDYRLVLERLFSFSSPEERVDYIFNVDNSIMKLSSQDWGTMYQADQIFGCKLSDAEQQQTWWFGHEGAISDIANAVFLYYLDKGEVDSCFVSNATEAQPLRFLVYKTSTTTGGDGKSVRKLELTFDVEHSDIYKSPAAEVEIEINNNIMDPATFDMFDIFKGIKTKTPKKKNPLPVVIISSSEVDVSLDSRHSSRVKKQPNFLRNDVVAAKSTAKKNPSPRQNAKKPKVEPLPKTFQKPIHVVKKVPIKKQRSLNKKDLQLNESNDDSFSNQYNYENNDEYDGGHYHGSNSEPCWPRLQQHDQPPLKRNHKSSDFEIHVSSTAEQHGYNTRTQKTPDAEKTTSALALRTLLDAAKKDEATRLALAVSDAQTLARSEEALKAAKLIAEVAEAHARSEALLQNSLAESKLQFEAILGESQSAKERVLVLQAEILVAEAAKTLLVATKDLTEENLILKTKLKSLKKGKVEIIASNRKERSTVMKIFQKGLIHTEQQNYAQASLVKSILKEHTSSNKYSSSSNNHNNHADDEERRNTHHNKRKREKKKRSKKEKNKRIKIAEEVALKRETEFKLEEAKSNERLKSLKTRSDEAKIAVDKVKVKKKKKESSSASSSSSSRSSSSSSSSRSSSSSTSSGSGDEST